MKDTNVVKVEARSVYGQTKVYPACDRAHLLAELVGAKTFTPQALSLIKRLGYQVVEVTPAKLAAVL